MVCLFRVLHLKKKMTESQLGFFRFLEKMSKKKDELDTLYHQDTNGDVPIDTDYLNFLESHLKNEIAVLQKKFPLSGRSVLVTVALLMLYFKYDAVKKYLVMSKDIMKFFTRYDEPMLILDLRDTIHELEDKHIIECKKIEFYPVRVFWDFDRDCNEHYLIPVKPNFVPFSNCKFELTDYVIEKITAL